MTDRLPFSGLPPDRARAVALVILMIRNPLGFFALLDGRQERREMRRDLERWADDGGPCVDVDL